MTDSDSEFGVVLWTFGNQASPAYFDAIIDAAERNGIDIVVVGDHVAFPAIDPDDHEYEAGPKPPSHFRAPQDAYETFSVLPYLAARTDLRLGTNVTVVPYRHPVVLAKQILTVAALSGNRFEFGAGVGWMQAEFDLLGVPFAERGARTDEFLTLFDAVLEDPETAFDGPFHSFDEAGFHPTVDRADLPIWIGGHSAPAFRRVAQFGDGWTSMGARPGDLSDARGRILRQWDEEDRDGEPRIAVTRAMHVGDDPPGDGDRPLVGPPEKVAADVRRYLEVGADRVILDFFEPDLEAQVEQLDRFGDAVRPAL